LCNFLQTTYSVDNDLNLKKVPYLELYVVLIKHIFLTGPHFNPNNKSHEVPVDDDMTCG
jgi:hypothetical protein